MNMKLARIILFVKDVPGLAAFYRDVLGLRLQELSEDEQWAELDGGGCSIALHGGGAPREGQRSHKIAFGVEDVAGVRAELIAKGAKLGEVMISGRLHLCDGK